MKKIFTLISIIAVSAASIYMIAAWGVMNALLVPSFMEKLDSFQKFTEKGYAEMVQTSDITENARDLGRQREQWLFEHPVSKLVVTSEDGYKLVAGQFLQSDKNAPWIILLHGYTGWKEEMYYHACQFYNMGFSVLCPDMRCQGESKGDFIGMGYTDAEDNMIWVNYIIANHLESDIVIMGESMGAACAIMMSAKDLPFNVKAVISDCAYTDAMSVFKNKMKDWTSIPDIGLIDAANSVLKFKGGYGIENADALKAAAESEVPTLFIHGEEDAMIPVSNAYALYDAEAAEKDILIVKGAGHAQSALKDPDVYYETIREFLEKYVEF